MDRQRVHSTGTSLLILLLSGHSLDFAFVSEKVISCIQLWVDCLISGCYCPLLLFTDERCKKPFNASSK